MKSIGKKIKAIYLLAIMAILSICVAVFPTFKAQIVNAEDAELSMTGAYVQFSKTNGADDFALMFQAKISKTFYDTVADKSVIFGMAIGPKDSLAGITTYTDLVALGNNVVIFDSLVTSVSASTGGQVVEFLQETDFFTYEAGTYFNKNAAGQENTTEATWKNRYNAELTAIPFYTLEGDVVFNSSLAITRSASQVVYDTLMLESAKSVDSDNVAVTNDICTAVTGKQLTEWYGDQEIYLSQANNKLYTNFLFGAATDTTKDQSFIRTWGPTVDGASANSFIPAGGYMAGQKIKASMTSHTAAFSTTHLTNLDALSELEAGKSYRYYYDNGTNIAYFEYKVVTTVFTDIAGTSGTQGEDFANSHKLLNSESSATIRGSYFTLRDDANVLYMPESRETESYDGYYILAGDLALPNQFDGIKYKTQGGQSADIASRFTNANFTRKTLGALKHIPQYVEIADKSNVVGGFTGTFDGRGYTIETSFARGGLFGVINGGTVKNLNIVADFYQYNVDANKQIYYTEQSYEEKAATLAEVIYDNSTIENVAIKIKENAPRTFAYVAQIDSENSIDNTPEMNNVPGVIAAQGFKGNNITLKNVIVECDTLKDANKSIQNYRAALNIADGSEVTIDNVFVIGSSYSNMFIDDNYTLTISVATAPEGFDFGEYPITTAGLEDYASMATEMYKWMRNEVLDLEVAKVKFVAEPATMKFATEDAFQEYLNDAGAANKTALIASGMWKDKNGALIWANEVIEGTTYTISANNTALSEPLDASTDANFNGIVDTTDTADIDNDGIVDYKDSFIDYFGWTLVFPELAAPSYNYDITLVG